MSFVLFVIIPFAIIALITCYFIDKTIKSDSFNYYMCRNDGLSHESALQVVEILKKKVGQPELPAWESKKRNLRKDEL